MENDQPSIASDNSHFVIPYVNGVVLAHVTDDAEEGECDLFGAIEIHNEVANSKSVLMPVTLDHRARTASVICDPALKPESSPSWFAEITKDPAAGIKKRECKKAMHEVAEDIESEGIPFVRMEFEIDILVPKDKARNVLLANGNDKLNHLSYQIREVGGGKSLVIGEKEMKSYMQNGHVFELIMEKLLGQFWEYQEVDMPYSMCRSIRWLSASYLTKSTRGNLMPQIMPIIEGMLKDVEMQEMREGNSEWGALSALTMAIGGSK
ncbi:hypothetical protein R2R70_02500 [Cobetia sp. SIMBA_158]|uniref:hypothetical protein n=1 Tax=Cobetia sp. SIMBA_158 TaxID=3081617 RepID=UPI00397FA3F1